MTGDDFDLESFLLPEPEVKLARTPTKILKRREHFIRLPFGWLEHLNGASGQVYRGATSALSALERPWRADQARQWHAEDRRGQPTTKYRALLRFGTPGTDHG